MDRNQLRTVLTQVEQKELSVEQALARMENLPYEDLGFAKVDHHRALRRGFPEVVFGQGKTTEQIVDIVSSLARQSHVLATRLSAEAAAAIREVFPHAQFNKLARTVFVEHADLATKVKATREILVCSAGTADIPVAEEAAVTAEALGNPVQRLYDVGVAGLHRLLDHREGIDKANVLIVVAGMDGVLPTVVSGLVNTPVVAVPTSVGYGASFAGVAPLLTMLNACSPGVVCVNIDNGFGAGYFATLINK